MNTVKSFASILISISMLYGCESVATIKPNETIKTTVHLVSPEGIGNSIGTIQFSDSAKGLIIMTNLKTLPAGPHGFHIHQNPSCEPDIKDGVAGAALKAGGHYDPQQTNQHHSPTGQGHLGDLPLLEVKEDQTSSQTLIAPRLTLADIRNRAVMIHAGGDNYSDNPQPLGGGGARIACGVIQ